MRKKEDSFGLQLPMAEFITRWSCCFGPVGNSTSQKRQGGRSLPHPHHGRNSGSPLSACPSDLRSSSPHTLPLTISVAPQDRAFRGSRAVFSQKLLLAAVARSSRPVITVQRNGTFLIFMSHELPVLFVVTWIYTRKNSSTTSSLFWS